MWGQPRPPINVAELWLREESKTLAERRQERSKYARVTPLEAMIPWTIHFGKLRKYKTIHDMVLPVFERMKSKLFHFNFKGSGNPIFYITRSTPEIIQADKESADKIQAWKDTIPKEDGSPYTPNAQINRKVCIWRGNITSLEVDAIVNAANERCLGGGGVDGAIHNAAGDNLYEECLTLNGCPTGSTKITRGHNLPSRFVLHTVGPVGEKPGPLTSCYSTCLQYIDGSIPTPYPAAPIRSIAFCGVSTGIYGYPLVAATKIALETTRKWMEIHHDKVDMIVFCTFLEKEWDCYESLMPYYFPPAPDAEFVQKWQEERNAHQTPSSSAASAAQQEPSSSSDEE